MLPQPPPDAPAPPPSEAALLSKRKWNQLLTVGFVSLGILVLLVLTAPLTLRSRKKSYQTEAVNNARQIGLALFEFETEYGKFPDASTVAAVNGKTGTLLPLGAKSSNDFFRQLLASGIAPSEQMFYAKNRNARKPDGLVAGSQALEKGECGFTYFLGATASDTPSRPLVVAPMIPGTDRFDPKPFKGKAVILKRDNSVTSLLINKDGHVIFQGRNLMDPYHPVWEGHAPVIAWPEF